VEVPDSALAVVVHAAGDLRIEKVPVRAPRADEAVIRIAYGGICGSDLHYWRRGSVGESILRAPMILGHEVVGTVARTAADGSGPVEETPVAVHPATPGDDGTTRYPRDRPNLSPAGTYLGSAARYPHTDGAFVEYATLPSRMLRPLPPILPLRRAALIEPASVAWHAAARAGNIAGRSALVVGAGPIGALAIAVLARAGAGPITAIDLHEAPLALAARVGATDTLLGGDVEALAATQADIVIESSGSAHGLRSAILGCARGGRVVLVGLLPSGEQPVLVSLITTRELELVGSFRFHDEIDKVIDALVDGSLVIDPVITDEYPIEDGLAAFERAANGAVSSKVLLRF
jgi:L-idonate 5-dehydrogenase